MKHFKKISLVFILTGLFLTSCDDFLSDSGLTESEVAQGLKSALEVGTNNSVDDVSKEDGYFGNPLLRIAFPPEVSQVETFLRNAGLGAVVDEAVLGINRAAEDAATEARPIFMNAISNITIADAFSILNGNNTAATDYLVQQTRSDLFNSFRPKIENSLDKVGANSQWNSVTTSYNNLNPFSPDVETDLAGYTTDKALDGLFLKVGQEEEKIRENPSARVNDILRRVFAEQD
ncbi:MAG: DUF4197 domain-containing protein [Chitinophagaceae bacterium]|nr:MAG: DUF4197 domain-containing protein [Chitinophagaceae bacterium]